MGRQRAQGVRSSVAAGGSGTFLDHPFRTGTPSRRLDLPPRPGGRCQNQGLVGAVSKGRNRVPRRPDGRDQEGRGGLDGAASTGTEQQARVRIGPVGRQIRTRAGEVLGCAVSTHGFGGWRRTDPMVGRWCASLPTGLVGGDAHEEAVKGLVRIYPRARWSRAIYRAAAFL